MARKTKPTADDLAKAKKRDKRRKGLRLKRAARLQALTTRAKSNRATAEVVALNQRPARVRGDEQPTGQIVFGMRTGLFGHPTTTVLRVPDEQIAGAVEDMNEMGEIVTKIGLLTLGALLNYNLAGGPEGLAYALAKWAGMDVEAMRKAAQASDEEQLAEAKRVLEATNAQQAEAEALTEAVEA
jgi:hypothetical protein